MLDAMLHNLAQTLRAAAVLADHRLIDALAATQQLRDKYTAKPEPEPAPRIELARIVDKEVQQ